MWHLLETSSCLHGGAEAPLASAEHGWVSHPWYVTVFLAHGEGEVDADLQHGSSSRKVGFTEMRGKQSGPCLG